VYFISYEWATVSGAGGTLFIAPTSKRAIGESLTIQVRWNFLKSDENSLEAGQGPDKSGASPVKSLWNLVDSPDKSGEGRKWKIWIDKHLDLSPNFFNASLWIVWLPYDSNKI
jgi:hypothetical protein